MLCSRCNRDVQPVVVLDIDGTLGNYHSHFIKFAEDYLQRTLPKSFAGMGTFWESLGLPLDEYRQIKLAYRSGGLKRSMPRMPYMGFFLGQVYGLQPEIWIATSRPYLRLDNIDPDTRFWLDHHGIMYDGLLFGDDKYEQLARNVEAGRVVAIVDDESEQLRTARRLFPGAAVMAASKWNEHVPQEEGIPRYTLSDAGTVVSYRIRQWRHKNA